MIKKKSKPVESNPFKARLDKMRKKYEETAGDDRWAKFKEGKSYIRILPPWGPGADGSFFLSGALHYGFKFGGRDRAIACSQFSNRGPCPVCQFVDKLKASGDEDLKKLGDNLRLRKKYWFNVIFRDKEGKAIPDAKIKMLGVNQKFLDAVMEAMDDPDTGDISDPDEGHDVVVKRTGTTMTDTRYGVTVRPRATPIERDGWQEDMFQLDEVVLEWMSESEILNAIAKNYGDEAADVGFKLGKSKKKDDDEEKPSKKSQKKKPTEDEEDSDDEDDEEEDDD